MALGDYTKTTYVNGSAPALSASNLNNNESKVDELDAALGTLIGSMVMYAGSSAPSGWLLCNGQAVSRTTYSALFTAIGTTWGVGNGSTTFNVPDMREAAPVGVGTFSAVTGTTHGTQVAADVYTLGQFKDDQGQSHQHRPIDDAIIQSIEVERSISASGVFTPCNGSGASINNSRNTGSPIIDSVGGTPRNGTVTRGKRIGLNFIIKY